MYPLWSIGLVSILPGLLWLWFFRRQDAAEPEPRWLLLLLFGLGMFSVGPALLIESPWQYIFKTSIRTGDLAHLALLSFGLVGTVEETVKLAVLLIPLKLAEYDEPLDGIIYGVTIGLGFAALENLMYAAGRGPVIGLFRAVVTSLAHAAFTGWLGYFMTLARYRRHRFLLFEGLILAIVLHGAYDFLLLGAFGFSALLSFIMVGGAMLLLLRKIAELESISPFHRPS